jgi:hypothetical protein
MICIYKNTKKFYIENILKINNYLFYGFGFTLLYYNPYLFLNSIIFILLFNNINMDLKINNENSFKIPYFNINGILIDSEDQKLDNNCIIAEVKKDINEDDIRKIENHEDNNDIITEVNKESLEEVKKEIDEEDEEDYEEDVMGNKYKRQDRYFTKI